MRGRAPWGNQRTIVIERSTPSSTRPRAGTRATRRAVHGRVQIIALNRNLGRKSPETPHKSRTFKRCAEDCRSVSFCGKSAPIVFQNSILGWKNSKLGQENSHV